MAFLGKSLPKTHEDLFDFGCGDGKISAQLAYFAHEGLVTGVDLSESMIGFAK